MVFRSFPESCAFAAAATLLELVGIGGVRDCDVARLTRIPYLWEIHGGLPVTGSQLVDNAYLNLATRDYGYSLCGDLVDPQQVPDILRKLGKPAMAGIVLPGHGHAVVIHGHDGQRWNVENIRFEREPETGWLWTDEELIAQLRRPKTALGWLEKGDVTPLLDIDDRHWNTVEKVFPVYRKMLREFWQSSYSMAQFREQLDPMLRGLVLEGPGLMGTIGEEGLQEKLARLQFAVMGALNATEPVRLTDHYPLDKLDNLLARYEAMLRRGIRTTQQ